MANSANLACKETSSASLAGKSNIKVVTESLARKIQSDENRTEPSTLVISKIEDLPNIRYNHIWQIQGKDRKVFAKLWD